MLKKFKVTNFKQFGELSLDFTEVRDYSFAESNVTPDKLLMKSVLLYGEACCGKTNLGYALLDAAMHLPYPRITTGAAGFRQGFLTTGYRNWLNPDEPAQFSYTVQAGGREYVYSYSKTAAFDLTAETLCVDGEELFSWHTLNPENNRFEALSRFGLKAIRPDQWARFEHGQSFLRFIAKRTQPSDRETIEPFLDFISRMLMVRVGQGRPCYLGFSEHEESLSEYFAKNPDMFDGLQSLFRDAQVPLELSMRGGTLYMREPGSGESAWMPLHNVGSSEMLTAAELYRWCAEQPQPNPSFVFIDDFGCNFSHAFSQKVFKDFTARPYQMLFATHDTGLLDHELTRPDCVLLMTGDIVRPLSSRFPKEIRKGNNLEKMFREGNFGAPLKRPERGRRRKAAE